LQSQQIFETHQTSEPQLIEVVENQVIIQDINPIDQEARFKSNKLIPAYFERKKLTCLFSKQLAACVTEHAGFFDLSQKCKGFQFKVVLVPNFSGRATCAEKEFQLNKF
jgi:hypothetical protein